MFVRFEKMLQLYQRALVLGIGCKLLKAHAPLIPYLSNIEEEKEFVQIDEFDYMDELDYIIRKLPGHIDNVSDKS